MLRKILNNIIALAFTGVIFFSCSTPATKETETSESKKTENELPNITFTNLDGSQTAAKSLVGKKAIIILFQPDCDHCQREATQIQQQLSAFNNYNLYFISSAEAAEIRKFSTDYKLDAVPNVHFAATDVQSILNSFGAIPAPSVYVYSEEGKMKSKFNGETDIKLVVKQL